MSAKQEQTLLKSFKNKHRGQQQAFEQQVSNNKLSVLTERHLSRQKIGTRPLSQKQ